VKLNHAATEKTNLILQSWEFPAYSHGMPREAARSAIFRTSNLQPGEEQKVESLLLAAEQPRNGSA
jgi:hypothetical protein